MVIPFPASDHASAPAADSQVAAVAGQQRLLHLGLLSAGMAHQVRHTLTALIGLSETLLEDLPATGTLDARRHAVLLRQESLRGLRLLRLWQGYLQRVGGAPLRAEPVPLQPVLIEEVVEDAVTLWRLQSPEAQVRLENTPLPSGLRILAPETALQQVLLNLFCNASQAMTASGCGGVLRVESWRKDRRVHIQVIDDGPGIPSERQASLFQPPAGMTAAENEAGTPIPMPARTGLGLWICRWLMEQMKGEIRLVESRPGHTCFELTLPLHDFASTRVEGPRRTRLLAAPPPERISFRRKPMKVLVIEDEPAVTEFLRAAFRRHGDHVHSVASLSLARRILLRSRWDLILLDWRLGQEYALKLLYWMERQRPDLVSQVLLISGEASPELHQAAGRRGLVFIEKPFTLTELWEGVRKFCVVAEEISSRAA